MTETPVTNPYLDPVRFPLTTQSGLGRDQQQFIDAFNRDSLLGVIELGDELTVEQQSILT